MKHETPRLVDRRDGLAGLGTIAAGMAFVNNAVAQENNPAAAVIDRASPIEALFA